MSSEPNPVVNDPQKPRWIFNWKLAVAAWGLFASSLFCPFFRFFKVNQSGWAKGWEFFRELASSEGGYMEALQWSISVVLESLRMRDIWAFLQATLFSQFLILMLANFFMLGSFILLFNRFSRLSKLIFLGVSFFFVLGCLYVCELMLLTLPVRDVGFGFYLWIISFGLLNLSISKNKTKQES